MTTRIASIAWIALVASSVGAIGDDRASRVAKVAVDRLDVLVEPDDTAFVSARLDRGQAVRVRKVLPDGWLAIEAPAGTFSWVDDDAIRLAPDGRVVVTSLRTLIRPGRENAPRPGPPRSTATRGASFAAVNQPILTYGEGVNRKVWRAIAVDGDDVRFVRAAGVSGMSAAVPTRVPTPPASPLAPPPSPERRVSHEVTDPADLPPEVAGPLREIDGVRRSIARGPVERWDFASVRRDYQALLASHSDPASQAAIRARLDTAARDDEMARAARDFVTLLKQSRQRDAEFDRIKRSVSELRAAEEQAFDAEGLLQGTAFRVDGEKVFLLLNGNGRVVTYLKIPPGVSTSSLMSRQVGVRGRSRFNDLLKFRLLEVRDIEALDNGR